MEYEYCLVSNVAKVARNINVPPVIGLPASFLEISS